MLKFLKTLLAADNRAPTAREPKPVSQESDPSEPLLASINIYRERMLQAAEREFDSSQSNAEVHNRKVERAERFLEESGLGHGMAKFMTTIWSTRNEAEKASENAPLTGKHGMQLTGGGSSDKQNEWITFFYGNHHYRAENRPTSCSRFDEENDYRYGEGSLFCDQVEVLRIETRRHFNDEYFLWKYSRVLVFGKGDWIPEIVDLFTKFDIEDRQLFPKLMTEVRRKQDSGIRE